MGRNHLGPGYQHFLVFPQCFLLYQRQISHYQTPNFRLSKLKQSAEDNFKFNEDSRKFSKWVENTAGKGEIAR